MTVSTPHEHEAVPLEAPEVECAAAVVDGAWVPSVQLPDAWAESEEAGATPVCVGAAPEPTAPPPVPEAEAPRVRLFWGAPSVSPLPITSIDCHEPLWSVHLYSLAGEAFVTLTLSTRN
jgi:hypothetical protein